MTFEFPLVNCKMGILPSSKPFWKLWVRTSLATGMATSQRPHPCCGSLWNISLQGRDVALPFKDGGGIFIQKFLTLCFSPLFCTHKFSTSSFQNQDLSLQDLQRKISDLQASLNHPKGELARLQHKTATISIIIRDLIGMLATMSTLSICSAHRI